MDNEASPPRIIKRRRRYSTEFKHRVLGECQQPNTSVAEVALRHGINLNVVHKWRHTLDVGGSGEFVRLPMPTTNELSLSHSVTQANATVSFRLHGVNGTITVEWPLREIDRSVAWLKALMP